MIMNDNSDWLISDGVVVLSPLTKNDLAMQGSCPTV